MFPLVIEFLEYQDIFKFVFQTEGSGNFIDFLEKLGSIRECLQIDFVLVFLWYGFFMVEC